eukprot:9386214-Pyramimonas_sp.AAC.1
MVGRLPNVAPAVARCAFFCKHLQDLRGLKANRFQHVALASTRRTFVLQIRRASRIEGGSFSKCGYRLNATHTYCKNCKSFADLGRVVFKMWLSP